MGAASSGKMPEKARQCWLFWCGSAIVNSKTSPSIHTKCPPQKSRHPGEGVNVCFHAFAATTRDWRRARSQHVACGYQRSTPPGDAFRRRAHYGSPTSTAPPTGCASAWWRARAAVIATPCGDPRGSRSCAIAPAATSRANGCLRWIWLLNPPRSGFVPPLAQAARQRQTRAPGR